MWTAEEMDQRSAALRDDKVTTDEGRVDDDLLDEIDRDIDEYRDAFAKSRGGDSLEDMMEPPDDLADLLWSMGWLIYEASWQIIQEMRPADSSEESERAARIIRRLAEAARGLPWPHFAPRALGAIRADALVASKRDTQQGFMEAFDLHEQARNRHADFVLAHGSKPGRELYRLGLQEILLQLVLAETGTACRTAERVIGRWAEGLTGDEPQWDADDEDHWVQLMFRQLLIGVQIGVRALEVAAEIEAAYGFIDVPSRSRLAKRTAFQNPGIMTARAASLLLAIGPAMQSLGRKPPAEFASWEIWEKDTVRRFVEAYTVIEVGVHGPDGGPAPMDKSFRRQLVHVRLNLALLKPGYDLPSARAGDLPCLAMNPLDAAALEAMSQWLEADRRGKERALGAATMPLFIRSLVAGRGLGEDDRGYREWRIKWFGLDQYSDERDRLSHMHWALTEAG